MCQLIMELAMRWSFVGEDREVMKVNIRKISEDTGFSMSTVSNALNRKKGVNKETAQDSQRCAKAWLSCRRGNYEDPLCDISQKWTDY